MAKDPQAGRIDRLEEKVNIMQRALGSQAAITEELRASHNRSIRLLTDAFNRADTPDLGALLGSGSV